MAVDRAFANRVAQQVVQQRQCHEHALWLSEWHSFGWMLTLFIVSFFASIVCTQATRALLPGYERLLSQNEDNVVAPRGSSDGDVQDRAGGTAITSPGGLLDMESQDRSGSGVVGAKGIGSGRGEDIELELESPPSYHASTSATISTSPRVQIQTPSPSTITEVATNPKPKPSSAHRFVLGFTYLTLNAGTLSTVFLTSQNMLYCYNNTPSIPVLLIPYTFLFLLLLHSTLCLSCFFVLLRNLWPESRRNKWVEWVRYADEMIILKGVWGVASALGKGIFMTIFMVVFGPVALVWFLGLKPLGVGCVWVVERCQRLCCGVEEEEMADLNLNRDEEAGLLEVERDTGVDARDMDGVKGWPLRGVDGEQGG